MTRNEMIEILDDAAKRLRRAPRPFSGGFKEKIEEVKEGISQAEQAWGQEWLGRRANVYKRDFQQREATDHFDSNTGFVADSVDDSSDCKWVYYEPATLYHMLFGAANVTVNELTTAAKSLEEVFERAQFDAGFVFDVLCDNGGDGRLCTLGEEIAGMDASFSLHDFRTQLFARRAPKNFMVRLHDPDKCPEMPAHLEAQCMLAHLDSHEVQLEELERHLLRAKNLVEHINQPSSQGTPGSKVFIGHGGAGVWKDLRFFLGSKLDVDVDEFNMEVAAGKTTKERLEEMLEAAGIAFLVLTAEDEHEDGTVHARENVIHEAGLFQGRLGFKRAILLLEEGCEEFSNIAGLTQIRFPQGNIMAKSEEIRGVLEREGFI